MTEKPSTEILMSPEYAMLEFGDAYRALIQGGKEGKDDNGEKIVDFVIKPSPLLRKRYDIKDSMLFIFKNFLIYFSIFSVFTLFFHF